MAGTLAILALTMFLSGAVLGVLSLLIVGIRTGSRDRGFRRIPRTHVEAITHRILGVGVRDDGDDTEEGD